MEELKKELWIEIMGDSLALTDGDGTGIRVCGPKQWGGGRTSAKFQIGESQADDFINNLKYCFPEKFNTRTESAVCNICHGSGELCKGARQCDHDGSECDNDHNCGEFEAGGTCWKCGGAGDISAKSSELEEWKSRYCRISEETMRLKEQMDELLKSLDNIAFHSPQNCCDAVSLFQAEAKRAIARIKD